MDILDYREILYEHLYEQSKNYTMRARQKNTQ